jgi:hypothetical protein
LLWTRPRTSQSPRSRLARAVLLLIAAVAISLALPASGIAGKRGSTFAGSCEFAGVVSFNPALGTSSQTTEASAEAIGPCTGTWRSGNRVWTLDGEAVRYHAESVGMQSCGQAEADGTGYFQYRDRRLRFSFHEQRVGTIAPLTLDGRLGGRFNGVATASGDPIVAIQSCLSQGLSEAEITITGSTDPAISG